MNLYTRLWARATRHAPLLTFSLIAVALLPAVPVLVQAHAGVRHALAAADAVPSVPPWLSPHFLAGLAALVAALMDGVPKVIYAVRKPVDIEVCPFALAGVARCHGLSAPRPPSPESKGSCP